MKTEQTENRIDLIIPWVDGSDPAWLQEKQRVLKEETDGDDRLIRFRDWDNLQYLFRGIEKFLPWIHTVHFVTWGHLPKWLNTNCEKLHIVKHTDYIPAEYLPTYSSHTIELNFHRIGDLAEHFIYANDDMFFLREMQPEDFFRDGLPVDKAVQNVLQFWNRSGIDHIVANDLLCINENFRKKECISRHRDKWFHRSYGKGVLQNFYLGRLEHFTGFVDDHIPFAYRKSTWEKVWKAEGDVLDQTCRNSLRTPMDVNQWLMRYWQLAEGSFAPDGGDRGRLYVIGRDDEKIRSTLTDRIHPMVCLSDDTDSLDFEKEKAFINGLLQTFLPVKSMFEI